MILKYNKDKIYNPKEFKNEVRRALRYSMDRIPKKIPLESMALKLLLWYPQARRTLAFLTRIAHKIQLIFESGKSLKSKEETKCLYHSQ